MARSPARSPRPAAHPTRRAEPWRVKAVEPIRLPPPEERREALEEAEYNLFRLKAHDVYVDLLTDSGTGAMSAAQWGAMFIGDESYAGARSFYHLEAAVRQVMGFPHTLPAHQGRGAEHVLMSAMVKRGDTVASNALFDTTRAHVEHAGARGVDLLCEKAFDMSSRDPFKGDMDVRALKRLLESPEGARVSLIIQTATSNMSGGQPVSMANQEAVGKLAREFEVPLFVDAARFAENAFFIQQREPHFSGFSVAAIALEFLAHADGCTMSAKKDALANIGGFLAFRNRAAYDACVPYAILFEGYPTYGGLAGRDLEAIARGLKEGVDDAYLASRVGQVQRLGDLLEEGGVPILRPVGGHAVYVDAARFLPHLSWEEFPGHALACALYLEAGVRAVEVGSLMAGRDPVTGAHRRARMELLRLALPRRTYTDNHIEYVAGALIDLLSRRDEVVGVGFKREAEVLPHFTSSFVLRPPRAAEARH